MTSTRRKYLTSLSAVGLGLAMKPASGEMPDESVEENRISGLEIIENFDGGKQLSTSSTQLMEQVGCRQGRSEFRINYKITEGAGIHIEYGSPPRSPSIRINIHSDGNIKIKKRGDNSDILLNKMIGNHKTGYVDMSLLKDGTHIIRYINSSITDEFRIKGLGETEGPLIAKKVGRSGTASVKSITSSPPTLGPGTLFRERPSLTPRTRELRKNKFVRVGLRRPNYDPIINQSQEYQRLRPIKSDVPTEIALDFGTTDPTVRIFQRTLEKARGYFNSPGEAISSVAESEGAIYITGRSLGMKIREKQAEHGKIQQIQSKVENNAKNLNITHSGSHSWNLTVNRDGQYLEVSDSAGERYLMSNEGPTEIVKDRLQMINKSLHNGGD